MNGPYLLDTNVLVHLVRAKGTVFEALEGYSLADPGTVSYVSVVSVGEMGWLMHRWKWGDVKRASLNELLAKAVRLGIDDPDVIDGYAQLDIYSRSLEPARPTGENDLWIAAAAKVSKSILLTTDTDFDHLEQVHFNQG